MQTTLIQTAAMSVADIGEGPKFFFETGESPYLRVWLTPPPLTPLSECLDLPLHVVHLCICHPLEFPFVMENRLDCDTTLKFDM